MTRITTLRIGALYLPIVAAFAAALLGRRHPRRFAACLLAILWTLPTLLLLQRLNQLANWWSFPAEPASLRAMPLELYLGWAVLWGLIPQLTFPRLNLAACTAIMAAFDLAAMPALQPLILLHSRWLLGELTAILLVLLPALTIARWTITQTHLNLRATIQLTTSALLFLYLFPELAFALRPNSHGWSPLFRLTSWQFQGAAAIILLLALAGVAAVMEFAQRGLGTPIPYDPPRRLVISGIYRYCANPMQLSCALVMTAWALLLRNPWLLIPTAISIVYSAGLANWDEAEDLRGRFGAPWQNYRTHVKPWRLSLTPHAPHPAKLYLAATCGPCSELRAWLTARQPTGLQLLDAETFGSIQRMTYDPNDGYPMEEGVHAMGRALEHLNLFWALGGALIRVPILSHFIQLAVDAAGLGPRDPAPRTLPRVNQSSQ
jgi:protein-S-isoprenylcysteine O-methyltransferase Ste14